MRAIIIISLLCSVSLAQEIRRPTVEDSTVSTTTGISCYSPIPTPTFQTTTAMGGNVYDTTNPPPNSTFGVVSESATTSTSFGTNHVFKTWTAASGAYSTMTVNISMICQANAASNPNALHGQCGAMYSTNSGGTWNGMVAIGATTPATQTTYSVVVPSASVTNLQVLVCVSSTKDTVAGSADQLRVWDIWTAGTLSTGFHRRKVIGAWQ